MNKLILSVCFVVLWATSVFPVSVTRLELSQKRPAVFTANVRMALNTTTGRTLVLWERHFGEHNGHSLWGRLLGPGGAPEGAEFRIVSGPNTYRPDLLYIPGKNQFVVIYSNELNPDGRFVLQAQRLNASGRRLGTPVQVSLSSDRQLKVANYNYKVLYEASAGIVVLWNRYGFASPLPADEGLYGAVLNTDLTLRRAPFLLSKAIRINGSFAGPYVTDVSFHRPSGKLLVAGYTVTNMTTGYSFRYFVSRVSPTLDRGGIPLTPVKSGDSLGAAPHAGLVGLPNDRIIATFVEGTGVRRRNFNALGAPIGPIKLLFGAPASGLPLEFPTSLTSTRSGVSEIAVIGQEDSTNLTGRLWLQTLNQLGELAIAPMIIHSNFTGTAPPAMSLLPDASPGFHYAIVMIEGVQTAAPPKPDELSIPVLLIVSTP